MWDLCLDDFDGETIDKTDHDGFGNDSNVLGALGTSQSNLKKSGENDGQTQ
jgi:hypothetical protein